MQEEMMTNRSVSMPPSLIEAVDRLAKQNSRSFSNYVCMLLEDHVAKADAKAAKQQAKQAPQVPA